MWGSIWYNEICNCLPHLLRKSGKICVNKSGKLLPSPTKDVSYCQQWSINCTKSREPLHSSEVRTCCTAADCSCTAKAAGCFLRLAAPRFSKVVCYSQISSLSVVEQIVSYTSSPCIAHLQSLSI